jgi:hypothetical protein
VESGSNFASTELKVTERPRSLFKYISVEFHASRASRSSSTKTTTSPSFSGIGTLIICPSRIKLAPSPIDATRYCKLEVFLAFLIENVSLFVLLSTAARSTGTTKIKSLKTLNGMVAPALLDPPTLLDSRNLRQRARDCARKSLRFFYFVIDFSRLGFFQNDKLMESDDWGTDRTHFYFFAASRIRRASAFRPATAEVPRTGTATSMGCVASGKQAHPDTFPFSIAILGASICPRAGLCPSDGQTGTNPQVLVNAASSTGRCNTFQRIDSAMLRRGNHLFGGTRSKPSQSSVSPGLTLASDFSFCFQCQAGSSLVLRRPIEITAFIRHLGRITGGKSSLVLGITPQPQICASIVRHW